MSTITLSMEEFFRPESASSVPSLAAGSAKNAHSAANVSRSAPENRARSPIFTVGGYSKSTSELVSESETETKTNKTNKPADLAKDDSFLHTRATQKKLDRRLENDTLSPFVQIPHVISAIPKIATSAVATAAVINGSDISNSPSPSWKPRSSSEDASAPPLRKLKSSLKLPNLTKSHSMSTLSAKSVRFATRLEKVKMFDGKASPSTVSLQSSPLGSPKYDFPVDDYFSIRPQCNDMSDDEGYSSSDSDTFTEFTKDKQYKITSTNFVSPQNIYDKRNSPVYLQSVSLTADKKSLVLLVMCQNLAFEKSLEAKFTFNDWHSSTIFNSAVYTSSFSSVNFDQFKFNIPLAHLPSSLSTQFCIKYSVNGTSFWDNNDTKNYKFSLDKYCKPAVSKDSFAFKPSVTKDSFTYKPPKFSPKSTFELGASTSAPVDANRSESVPKSGSTVTHYKELVSKLMSVKVTDERPKYTRSLTSSPRPRYSQSYIAKQGTESGQMSPVPMRSSTLSSAVALEPKPVEKAEKSAEKLVAVASTTRPKLPHSFASAPANLSNTNIRSMSYADLLQNYCFNGADKSIKTSCANPVGSFNSSCNSSSSSLNSDFMAHASFHSTSDTFYV